MATHWDKAYYESDVIEELWHDCSDEESLTNGDGVSDSKSEDDGEPINIWFTDIVKTHKGVTGTVFEQDGKMYVQRCLLGKFCYVPCNLYEDTDHTLELLVT